MRPARKRIVRRKHIQTVRRKSMGDGTATSKYMHNVHGRAAMQEALAEQRRRQDNLCAECQQFMHWDQTKFKHQRCPDGVENLAVHRRCPDSAR